MAITNNSNLEIGQVIYIVSNEDTKIFPVVVSEQVTVKTLNGDTTTWKVILGPSNEKRRTLQLEKIAGEKYASLEEAKRVLLDSFNSYLNSAIAVCEKKVDAWYANEVVKKNRQPKKKQSEPDSYDPESLFESIEDNEPQQREPVVSPDARLSPMDSPEIRKAKMKAMLTVEEEPAPLPSGPLKMIRMPDGQEVVVTSE